ncbi:MAG TPA: TIGR04283 family arsenosugar biosynthesis glycosyltransferase [Casimicrobiaceae bacterium]|nr:TIGR04283 family arsenosugar biosynthesis glycosyltransferase [Casimicrobiaceae bacterium]
MRLAIVVPARNEAAGIGATLASLQPFRARGHEVIVVDGGSDDATRAIAAPLADAVRVAHRGRASQMNAGAACDGADALLFLHADTRLPERADMAVADALKGAHWGRFDVAIDGRSAWLPLIARAMNVRSRLTGIATGDQAMFVSRPLFERVGGFPALALMEDVALSSLLKRVAGPPACLRDVVVTSGRRWDAQGALRTIATMSRLRFDFRRGVSPDTIAERYGGRSSPTLQVFAREPVPGQVKTRLAAAIGAARAADLYRMLAERTLAAAAAARARGCIGDIELWCASASDAAIFHAWCDRFGAVLIPQCAGDLGARMHHALGASLARGRPAVLVGTDCPDLDADYLCAAASALAAHDVVIGPAADGGYVLIGLARDMHLFSGMAWSTPQVFACTRERVALQGLRMHALPERFDIDTADDYARYEAATARAAGL